MYRNVTQKTWVYILHHILPWLSTWLICRTMLNRTRRYVCFWLTDPCKPQTSKLQYYPRNFVPNLSSLIEHHCPQFHAHQLLLNDIMEGTEMRRGAPCWYKHPEVGLSAINDAALIQAAMFSTLKRHFNNKMYYKSVLETFNEVCSMLIVYLWLRIVITHALLF